MSGLLTLAEVTRLVGYSRTSIWRLTKADRFPQPVKLPSGQTRFRADEVQAWIDALPRRGEETAPRTAGRAADAPAVALAAAGARS